MFHYLLKMDERTHAERACYFMRSFLLTKCICLRLQRIHKCSELEHRLYMIYIERLKLFHKKFMNHITEYNPNIALKFKNSSIWRIMDIDKLKELEREWYS